MIEHLVLFKWRDTVTPRDVAEIREALLGMRGRIDGLQDLVCGENFSERAQGWQFGLAVRFETREALEAYARDPVHEKVVEQFINPARSEVLALDFEI
ncbi:MAG: Dabb family protein [Armatimonadetes bacterium]|nr:Dabb family protein [Armatimonadota bacterium]MDE2206118.1 Dabb family protein [Armatimonadota bacterium]